MESARDTTSLLEEAGYEYRVVRRDPAVMPERVDATFEGLHPGFAGTRLAGARLYRHQLEALSALEDGANVILVSGTGSGKTEAWYLYLARKWLRGERARAVAVYPTLALAWDQLERLKEYGEATGVPVERADSLSLRRRGARARLARAGLVVTNPAMLLSQLKKHLLSPGSSPLSPAIENLDLLVVDELDFYGPREIALLLGMIEILARMRGGSLQVAVLTATLANPGDLAVFLESITGRPGRVVRGRPFHPENRTIVVLGKDLERLRARLLERAPPLEELPREIREALVDPRLFAERAYLVVDYLRGVGVDVPGIGLDTVEILEWFARGQAEPRGVTLAFTGSIAEAERLARQLRERLGPGGEEAVAAHHHLVPKEERARIERLAREGRIRLILTPRTLAQGLDIGGVVRIVHVGLPQSLREYWQREGRKGRRPGIRLTETLIIPRGRWDRELLRRGTGALEEWLSLPLEKAWINPGNHYKALLTGASKLLARHPALRGGELTRLEEEALGAAGLLGADASRLSRFYRNLNFYEYGPPYGVKRVLEEPGRTIELEEIGRCDLVEKFQPGCFDPGNDAIVVRLVTPPSRRDVVSRVVEWRLRRALEERRPYWIVEALESYRSARARWGEDALLLRDFSRGLVESEAETVVYPPGEGFGLLRKIPYRCAWRVSRARPSLLRLPGGRVLVYREKTLVHVPAETAGSYRDYTYGLEAEAPPGLSADALRLGLATLNVLLRRRLGVPLGLLKYSVYSLGERALVEVHEESAAGILPRLDWEEAARAAEEYVPGGVDDVLLMSVDEYAYLHLAALGMDWGAAREAAAAAARMLAARQSLEVALAGRRIRVPRPSRGLGLGSVSVVTVNVEIDGLAPGAVAAAAAYFDGSTARTGSGLVLSGYRRRPPGELRLVELAAEEDAEYEGFQVLVFHRESTARELEKAGLRILARLAREGSLDVYEEARRLGLPLSAPGWITPYVEADLPGGLLEGPGPRELLSTVARLTRRPLRRAELPDWAASVLEGFARREAVSVYLAHLALQALSRHE